jgi:acyl carrier protein
MDDVREKLRGFLGKHLRDASFKDNANIFRSGHIDSLFAMQLVMFLEMEFSVKLDSEDLKISNFKSINSILDLISRKQASKQD